MTNQIVKATSKSDRSQEINNLHSELKSMFRRALPMAIRIGELLEIQKEELPHGEFESWIDQNLHFTKQTAHNYRKLYRIRKQLKSKRILLLNEAYIEAGVLTHKIKVVQSKVIKPRPKLIKEEGYDFGYYLCETHSLDIRDIEPNPFFDMNCLVTEWIEHWVRCFKSPVASAFILVVRLHDNKYQNVTHHERYYAHHKLGTKEVPVSVIELTDDQMKWVLENWDYESYREYIDYKKQEAEYQKATDYEDARQLNLIKTE